MVTILHAACRHPQTGAIVTGTSHADAWIKMFPGWSIEQIAAFTKFDLNTALEGFVTSEGSYVSRAAALLIALAARQANISGGMLCRDDKGAAILISEATTYQPAA